MKLNTVSWAAALPLALVFTAPDPAASTLHRTGLVVAEGGPAAAPPEARPIHYVPSRRGTPATRIASQTRGAGDAPQVLALAPYDTGETTLAQPTLYWYVSRPVNAKVEVTVVEEATQKTVLETVTDGPKAAGIWGFPLGIHRVTLQPGVEYRWSVSVVRDPAQRSLDLYASGTILRVNLPGPAASQLNSMRPAELPYFLAGAGLWYDALAVLSVQIVNNPGNRGLRETRASLLEQVGLAEAASFDRTL